MVIAFFFTILFLLLIRTYLMSSSCDLAIEIKIFVKLCYLMPGHHSERITFQVEENNNITVGQSL